MTITIIIVSLVLLYILPVYYSYRFMSIAHSKGGIFGDVNTDFNDILLVVIPFLNWVLFVEYIQGNYIEKVKKETNYNNFFKVKK